MKRLTDTFHHVMKHLTDTFTREKCFEKMLDRFPEIRYNVRCTFVYRICVSPGKMLFARMVFPLRKESGTFTEKAAVHIGHS